MLLGDGDIRLNDSNMPLDDSDVLLDDSNCHLDDSDFHLGDSNFHLGDSDIPLGDGDFQKRNENKHLHLLLMLHFKIKELILQNGHPNPGMWLRKHCGLGKNKAYHIISGKQKFISVDDFTTICAVIDCSPNELFYWEQTPRHTLPEGHSCLTKLTPPDGNENWNNIFSKMSQDEIADMKNYALDKLKGK